MKRTDILPENYQEYRTIDLMNNKKQKMLINVLAAVIGLAIIALGALKASFMIWLESWWVLLVSSGLTIVYMVLHELTHGIAMKMMGTKKVRYGFTGLYAFAGSDDYYARGPYIFIALAPVVLFGVILGVLSVFLDGEWFWAIHWVQAVNISGAAGDFFVTCAMLKAPKDVLVKDAGTAMKMYSATK